MKRTSLVIGNWKMNPNSLSDALQLVEGITQKYKARDSVIVAIAPPALYISDITKKLGKKAISLATQNVSTEPMGAFTGELSALQLRNAKVEYVIIGHSERRAMGETDAHVQKKVQNALKNKLTPVVCVGERERDTQGKFYTVIELQIKALAAILTLVDIKKVVIAYEPIWAIGTGQTASPADVKEMQLFLFATLTKLYDKATASKVALIYGGSVKPENVDALHREGGMNGFLPGGASLKAEDFLYIINAAAN